MRNKFFIGLCLLLAACKADKPEMDVKLHACAAMPSARASATVAVVGEDVYVFGGRNEADSLLCDIWRYTPSTNQWDSIGEMPMCARVNATACVQDGKIYIGLGFNGLYKDNSSYRRDWWEYNPNNGSWRQLADYPNSYTDRAVCFHEAGRLFVGYGFCWNYRRDMFRYNIAANSWDSIDTEVPFMGYPNRSFGGTGCTCDGRHFMGTGFYRFSLDWWAEFDGQHWSERTPVPGKTRTLAASCATKESIYVTAGIHYGGVNTTGEVLRDIRRYDPNTDHWTYVAVLPKGLFNHVCFAVGNRVYVGLGETEDWQINDKIYWFEE